MNCVRHRGGGSRDRQGEHAPGSRERQGECAARDGSGGTVRGIRQGSRGALRPGSERAAGTQDVVRGDQRRPARPYDLRLPSASTAQGGAGPCAAPVDRAATQARQAARQAADYTQPKIESAIAAATPVAEEAASRSTAAFAALRGQVTAKEVQKLVRRRERHARNGKILRGVALVGVLACAAYAVWRWWDQQSNPDWLVEPPHGHRAVGARRGATASTRSWRGRSARPSRAPTTSSSERRAQGARILVTGSGPLPRARGVSRGG